MKPYILVNQDVRSCAACWTGVRGGRAQRRWHYLKKKVWEICTTDHEEMQMVRNKCGVRRGLKKGGGVGLSLIAAKAVKRNLFNVSHMCRAAERRVVMEGDGAWAHLFINNLAYSEPYRAITKLPLTFYLFVLI